MRYSFSGSAKLSFLLIDIMHSCLCFLIYDVIKIFYVIHKTMRKKVILVSFASILFTCAWSIKKVEIGCGAGMFFCKIILQSYTFTSMEYLINAN